MRGARARVHCRRQVRRRPTPLILSPVHTYRGAQAAGRHALADLAVGDARRADLGRRFREVA